MKNNLVSLYTFRALTGFLALILTFLSPSFALENSEIKAEQLEQERQISRHTLAQPTLLGNLGLENTSFASGSLLTPSAFEAGTAGDILFQKIGNTSFRLSYHNLKEDASFFWLFEKPVDMKDRWVQLDYSSVNVPATILLSIDSGLHTDGIFTLPLENSLKPKSSFFKLPDRAPYNKVDKISLSFPSEAENHTDLLIYDLKLLPEGQSPLEETGLPLQDTQWYTQPLHPDNRSKAEELYLQFMQA
jgi:hypothetical protein